MLQKNDGQQFHCIHFSCLWNSTTSEVNSTDNYYIDSSKKSLGMHQQISSYAASYQSKDITLSLARVYLLMQLQNYKQCSLKYVKIAYNGKNM